MRCSTIISLAVIALAFTAPTAPAQPGPPDTLWTRTFGGDSTEHAYAVEQTSDGGYIITGYSMSFGGGANKTYLIRTDHSGDTLWTKAYTISRVNYPYDVKETIDGGFIIVGYKIIGSYRDLFLLKVDSLGNQEWERFYGGSDHDVGHQVLLTPDGGYIAFGYTYSFGIGTPSNSNFYLLRVDSLGNELEYRTYGGTGKENGYCFDNTADGGYILGGLTGSYGAGAYNIFIVKIDSSLNQEWQQTFGGPRNDMAYSVKQTSDGGYAVAGFYYYNGQPNMDFYLVKTDSVGNEIWARNYGGYLDEECYGMDLTLDGGFILCGYTRSFATRPQAGYIVKADSLGNEQWNIVAYSSFWSIIEDIDQLPDGCYIACGLHEDALGEFWLLKINSEHSPKIALSTDSLFFDNTVIDSADTLSLTIYNEGFASLTINRMTLTFPDNFSHSWNSSDSLIFPLDSLNIEIYFTPQDTVYYEDYLTIENNDTSISVYLSGRGILQNSVENPFNRIADGIALSPAYPNPFNGVLTLSYSLASRQLVTYSMYDICGREKMTVPQRLIEPGKHRALIDCSELSSGIYFLNFRIGDNRYTEKVLLIR